MATGGGGPRGEEEAKAVYIGGALECEMKERFFKSKLNGVMS